MEAIEGRIYVTRAAVTRMSIKRGIRRGISNGKVNSKHLLLIISGSRVETEQWNKNTWDYKDREHRISPLQLVFTQRFQELWNERPSPSYQWQRPRRYCSRFQAYGGISCTPLLQRQAKSFMSLGATAL